MTEHIVNEKPPVLFVHGTFGHPDMLIPWIRRFEAAGFETHAPALPGRDPINAEILRSVGVAESYNAVLAARNRIDSPCIVVGHSFGGLLAQKLAEETETAALVLLASVPPGVNWPLPSVLPHLMPMLPKVITGRPVLPSPKTFRAVPFNTLPRYEQDELIDRMVPDSGRVFRSMTFGTGAVRVDRSRVTCPVLCVSGTADRNVSGRSARRIAQRYAAAHHIHPDVPHWIIAESILEDIFPPVLQWLEHRVTP